MKRLKILTIYLFCALSGLIIPACFAISELLELELTFNITNIVRILESQNIYLFSSLLFPLFGIAINYLILRVKRQTRHIKSEFRNFKSILDACPDPIVFLDKDKKIIFQNEQFLEYFDCIQDIRERFDLGALLKGKTHFHGEVSTQTKLMDEHPFLFNYKTIDINDHTNHFLSFTDLKNLKDKENIIEDQRHQVIEKTRLAALGEMAAGIAHEINNPLTIIHSNNSIISKNLKADKLQTELFIKLIDKNSKQVHRITSIISALRNLSRGMANDDSEVFSVDEVLEEVMNLSVLRDTGRKIEFKHTKTKYRVFANRGHVVQIILNLVNNAMDEIENLKSPWIEFYSDIKDGNIEIHVKDCGHGIDQKTVNKIFTPMFTTKEVGKGTGLGLSLSKTYAEQNNGQLIYDASHSNTCFKLILPSDIKVIKDLKAS